MSIETEHRAALLTYGPLAALLPDGRQIAISAINEGVPTPYVVLTARQSLELGLSGSVLGDDLSIEYQCWAQTALQASELAAVLIDAIRDKTEARPLSLAIGYDEETQRDCVVVTSQMLLT
jgi:hypothetical protein